METARSLTIIVPIHGISKGINRLKNWISSRELSQSQIILIHDSSDGESFEPVLEMCKDLKNIIFLEGNYASPGLARNRGLENANREWVTFWDFDDEPNPHNFLKLLDLTISDGNEIGVGAFQTRGKARSAFRENKVFRSEIPCQLEDLMINPGLWRWVFKRELIGDSRFLPIRRGEDQLFLAQIEAFDYSLTFFTGIVYTYFTGDEFQLSSKAEFDHDLLVSAFKFLKASRTKKPNTSFYSRVAFLSSSLTYMKRSSFRKSTREYLLLCPWIILTLSRTPKAIVVITRRHIAISTPQKDEGKILDLYLAGGLGNQLFQIAFVCSYKNINEIRLHQPSAGILDLIDYGLLAELIDTNPNLVITSNQSISFLTRLVRNQCLRLCSRKREYNFLYFRIFKYVLSKLMNIACREKSILVVPNGLGHDSTIDFENSFGHLSIVGYFQSHVWADKLSPSLSLALEKRFQTSDHLSSILDEIESSESILVHLRFGDYLEKKNAEFGVVSREYVETSLVELGYAENSHKLVIFSNDLDLAKSYFSKFMKSNLTFVSADFTDLESLYLLSKGKCFIISNSTFSWWGAYLSTAINRIVVAPTPWFKKHDENPDLVPLNWVRRSSGW